MQWKKELLERADELFEKWKRKDDGPDITERISCLLYTSDAADERSSVDLGGRRIIKKKKKRETLRVCIANTEQIKQKTKYRVKNRMRYK